jgi:hypothetical protein
MVTHESVHAFFSRVAVRASSYRSVHSHQQIRKSKQMGLANDYETEPAHQDVTESDDEAITDEQYQWLQE